MIRATQFSTADVPVGDLWICRYSQHWVMTYCSVFIEVRYLHNEKRGALSTRAFQTVNVVLRIPQLAPTRVSNQSHSQRDLHSQTKIMASCLETPHSHCVQIYDRCTLCCYRRNFGVATKLHTEIRIILCMLMKGVNGQTSFNSHKCDQLR